MNFLKRGLEAFLLKTINVDRYLPLQLDITNACNLRCVHCYHPHHKNEGALSLGDWKKIILQYKNLIQKMKYRPSIVLCGGEPLASPFLKPLIEFITKEMGQAQVSILTNGTLVTESIAQELRKVLQLRFQVSLDGPDQNRHDLIRGKGSFEKALRGIRILKAHGFDVNVLSVLSRRTLPWMEDFFKLSQAEKFNSMNFTRFISEGYGRDLVESSEDEPLLGHELKSAYQKLIHFMVKYQVKSVTQGPLFELVIPGLGRNGRFWESIVVDYQGYVIASSRSKLRLGHVFEKGLEDVFVNHPIYQSLRRAKVEECGECKLYSVCGGDRNAAFAATGNFLGKDPGCWKNNENSKQSFRRVL